MGRSIAGQHQKFPFHMEAIWTVKPGNVYIAMPTRAGCRLNGLGQRNARVR